MFELNSVVDGVFQVTGLCSDSGGMGTVLFVRDLRLGNDAPRVLKFCKATDPDDVARFRREVRTMQSFEGNQFVAPILYANLEHSPPFFVMPFFPHSDLTRHAEQVRYNLANAESCFRWMIECVGQLHARHVFHRDIKPQNFLVDDGRIVVSDLGLCRVDGSSTELTRTMAYGGTPAYSPPEFNDGGFKGADATSDIYMLGVSFVRLFTGMPMSPASLETIPGPLRVVLERATAPDKARRYQDLSQLAQSLLLAFDVLLGRLSQTGGARGALHAVLERWTAAHHSDEREIEAFISALMALDTQEMHRVCMELPPHTFDALGSRPFAPGLLEAFLKAYGHMASNAEYAWSFAENIADGMRSLFQSHAASSAERAEALRIAIVAAVRQNRFAAMNTCTAMITSVSDPELAQRVVEVMIQHHTYFMQNIDPTACRSPAIAHAIERFKQTPPAGAPSGVFNFLNS